MIELSVGVMEQIAAFHTDINWVAVFSSKFFYFLIEVLFFILKIYQIRHY